MGKLKSSLLAFTGYHFQFQCVGQGMKQNYLYMIILYCQLNEIDAINKFTKHVII